MRALVVAAVLVGCAARQTTNVERLIASVGVDRARAELKFRVASHPKDLDAHRALAILEDEHGRPGAAIRHLLIVERAGGLLGTRWATEDRKRLAKLLLKRGNLRALRDAPSAIEDLTHAQKLGAKADRKMYSLAQVSTALTELRHASSEVRKEGLERLHRYAKPIVNDPTFGTWLWQHGAKRAALDVLDAAARPDPASIESGLRARRWWMTPETPRFDGDGGRAVIKGAEGFPCLPAASPDDKACSPALAAADPNVNGPSWQRDLVAASRAWPLTRDPEVAAAWVLVTLRVHVKARQTWLSLLRGRVDVASVADTAPGWARSTLLRAAGRPDDARTALQASLAADLTPGARVVVAAEAVIAGMPGQVVRDLLKPVENSSWLALWLVSIAEPPAAFDYSLEDAVVASALRSYPLRASSKAQLASIARSYAEDPAVADRMVEEVIDSEVDEALGMAIGANLFDALGDLARARAMWQRALDASPEQAWRLNLALTAARAGDGDAAILHLTAAAAASGDSAPVMVSGARALLEGDRAIQAIEVAHQAIELAGPDVIGDALAVAAEASAAAGRNEQAAALLERRARVINPTPIDPNDPADAAGAVAAFASRPPADGLAALEVAARWNTFDVATRRLLIEHLPASDPRARRARSELGSFVSYTGNEADDDLWRRALAALRAHP